MECSQLHVHSLVSSIRLHSSLLYWSQLLLCFRFTLLQQSIPKSFQQVRRQHLGSLNNMLITAGKSYAYFSSLIAYKIKNEFLSKTVSTNVERRRNSQLEPEELILPVNDCTIIFFCHSRVSEVKSLGEIKTQQNPVTIIFGTSVEANFQSLKSF